MSLTQRVGKTTYTISSEGGYTEDFFDAENREFTQYYIAIGRVSHQLLAKMTVGLFGSYEWIRYYRALVETRRQQDNIWWVGGDATYQLLRWLRVSCVASYREDDSNFDTADYSEYRGIFSITASF